MHVFLESKVRFEILARAERSTIYQHVPSSKSLEAEIEYVDGKHKA